MRAQLPIETSSLVIRGLVAEDAAVILALSNEETLRAWLPNQLYRSEAEAQEVVEFLVDQYAAPAEPRLGPFVLAVEHRGDRTLIGDVGFSPFEGEVEIGYAIGQRYQRRGLASEAVYAASRWARVDRRTARTAFGFGFPYDPRWELSRGMKADGVR